MTMAQAFQQGMREEMERDPRIFVLGTDLFDRGGHFAQVLGLGKEFGRERVRDMPISEAAMVAAGVGAALNGMRPVVDLNFIDFAFGAMDEIVNQAAKMRYMFGTPVPLVIRASSGVALYAAQHNNSLEALFAPFPGLLVAMPATPADTKGLHQVGAARRGPGHLPDAQAPRRHPRRGGRAGRPRSRSGGRRSRASGRGRDHRHLLADGRRRRSRRPSAWRRTASRRRSSTCAR